MSRGIETAMESVPQMVLQALALADLNGAAPSAGQYISIAWSIVNIACTFVSVSVSMDTGEILRVSQPLW